MNYLLTGATGLIGSHILFELLKGKMVGDDDGRLYALVRAKSPDLAMSRIAQLLDSTLLPDYLAGYDSADLLRYVRIVDADLNAPDLAQRLRHLPLSHTTVIHAAASTNLMPGRQAEEEIFLNNTLGTKNLLHATRGCHKFAYVSTAFSCGIQSGVIRDHYHHEPGARYRNPYEKNKYIVEGELRHLAANSSTRFQILRPSVVSGRLHDSPLFETSKFDVFYGWARFFWAYREAIDTSGLRVWINPRGTMNIVPVDYVAKSVMSAVGNDELEELNIVHAHPPLHIEYLTEILDEIGVRHVRFVDRLPAEMNRLEKLYYRSVGLAFNPYLVCDDARFDTTSLRAVNPISPEEIATHMRELIRYAVSRQFNGGLKCREASRGIRDYAARLDFAECPADLC